MPLSEFELYLNLDAPKLWENSNKMETECRSFFLRRDKRKDSKKEDIKKSQVQTNKRKQPGYKRIQKIKKR